MTDTEKIAMVQALVDDSTVTETIATTYLTLAWNKIMSRCYPFKDTSSLTLPAQYDVLQCELAARYIQRRGVEGEIGNTDNGVHRTYATPNDEDLLAEVTQIVTVL